MALKVDSQVQTEWNWNIAVYLFLAGVGAGGYAAGVLASFGGEAWERFARTGVALGWPLLMVGTVFLILDLGVKVRALRVFLNPGTSWIARGSLFISAFMILSFVHLVLMVWPWRMPVDDPTLRVIGSVNLVFSVLVMIYTGVLLGASRSIAFWNTAMLPLLFLVSASSTGLMAVLLLMPESPDLVGRVARIDTALVALECLVVALYLQASHRTDESRAAVQLLVRGRLAAMFWVGLVVVGLAVPLALGLAQAMAIAGDGAAWLTKIAAAAGLVGGLLLRRLVLAAGVRAPLRAAGIEFPFPSPVVR